MSSSSDSGSEDWRWDSSTISDSVPSELSDREIPEGYLQQEIKTSCRIQSHVSQPSTPAGPHGPGPAAARRVSFWAWNCKESRDARCRCGLQLMQGFSDGHDDVDQRLGNNDW